MTITLRDRAFRRTAVRLVTRCKRLSKLRVLIWITLLFPDEHALFFWLISARPTSDAGVAQAREPRGGGAGAARARSGRGGCALVRRMGKAGESRPTET